MTIEAANIPQIAKVAPLTQRLLIASRLPSLRPASRTSGIHRGAPFPVPNAAFGIPTGQWTNTECVITPVAY